MQNSTRSGLASLSLLATTAVWGVTFIFVKWAIAEIDLYYFLFLRFGIASLIMAAVFHGRLRRITLPTIKAGALLGILFTAIYIAQTEGLRFTSAANSAFITGLYMVIIPICMYFWKGMRPHIFSILAIFISMPGMYLMTECGVGGINRGDLITLIAAFAAAWHIVMTGEFSKRHPVVPLVTCQFVIAAIICGIVAMIRGGVTIHIPMVAWGSLAITSVFATCVAFMVMTFMQRYVDTTRAGIIFAMEAVFGALFGYVIGGEILTTAALFGAGLMTAGMIISEIHPLTRAIFKKISA